MARDSADGAGGIKHRGHHQRQHAWQNNRVQGADDIQATNQGVTLVVAQRRHGENAGEVNGRIENQTDNRNTDDGQQNTARHLQFFQADNHRQTNQRHNHREAGEMAHGHWQAVQWVFDYQTNAVRCNQQQEQADTDTGAVRHALRQVAQDPATNPGGGDEGEQHTHQEYRTQRDRHADVLTQHQAKRGKGGQRDRTANRQRQVCPQAHDDGADARNQTGGNENGRRREAGFTQHARHHDDGVNHRQKRRQTCNNFLTHGAAASRNFKQGVE